MLTTLPRLMRTSASPRPWRFSRSGRLRNKNSACFGSAVRINRASSGWRPLALQQFDLNGRRTFDIGNVDVSEGSGLGCKLHTLGFEFGGLRAEVHCGPPTDMIDGVALARRGLAFLRENPDLTILQSIHASLQLFALTAKHLEVPLEGAFGVRCAQMDVVEAQRLRILQDLDFGAPWIFNESVLKESRLFLDRRDDFDACRLQLHNFCG